MYWGKYVAHDNNRDGMGQFLALTRNVDEGVPRLEADRSCTTCTRRRPTCTPRPAPVRTTSRSIRSPIDEWWLLAKTEVMEMTKRGVPGVWTYGFYDGWVPNYMFFIAHAHNAIGRFYEVRATAPTTRTVAPAPTTTSREWFRPNPPLPSIQWGPRNNTNIQQSAILIALNHVAKNKETYLENYWLKNKRAVDKGKDGPVYGWVIPAAQKRKADAADAVNELRRQGLEVPPRDQRVQGRRRRRQGRRLHHPRRPAVSHDRRHVLLGTELRPSNPRPYDDTGWTFQYMRNLAIKPIADRAVLDQQMALVTADVKAPGGIDGTGPVADRRPHHRQQPRDVPLQAQGRGDGGRRGGIRSGRPASSVPARSSSRTPIARRSSRR